MLKTPDRKYFVAVALLAPLASRLQISVIKLKMSADLERTPRTLLVCDRSSFRDEKNRVSCQVEQLHLNYKVTPLAS